MYVNLILESGDHVRDVTTCHLFVGYKPLIIGVSFNENENIPDKISLIFTEKPATVNFHTQDSQDPVAKLHLKKNNQIEIGENKLVFYEAISGEHTFISRFHQFTNRLYHSYVAKKPGNISLDANLYDQVRIAYSVPRTISLITVGDGHLMNMFPTDLHGFLGDNYYVISLRIEGKASAQVGAVGKLALSEMPPSSNKKVYALGKNHMKPLSGKEHFGISAHSSIHYKFPLPKDVLRYHELEIMCYVDIGIHRIYLFRIQNRFSFHKGPSLSHIHNYYAQWKKNTSAILDIVPRSH